MCKIFIIEGPDYSGKTTLVNSLYEYFKSIGKRVAIFKEPSGKIRDMLLDKDGNLPFATRRFLFAADHFQTMEFIYKSKDRYDIILMDRSAVVSDMVHSSFETDNIYASEKITEKITEMYPLIDAEQYENFFICNSYLILLKLPKSELINRMYSRAINRNDINDIKGDDFKIQVWEKYNELIGSIMSPYGNPLSRTFNTAYSVEVDDNLGENVKKIIEGDKYV